MSTAFAAPAAGAVLLLPPPNDNFAAAEVVGGLPFGPVTVDTSDATQEPNDPEVCFGAGPTVWYRFTPVADVRAEANTFGSNYDTTLSVYTGTHADLEEIACNDDSGSLQSRVRWDAEAGVDYFIMVGAYDSGPGGSLMYTMDVAPPAIDVGITIDRDGLVTETEGTAEISGTVTCSAPDTLSIIGVLVQETPTDFAGAYFFVDDIDCAGEESWSTTVIPEVGRYARGPAFVEAIVYDFEDNEMYTARNIRLLPSESAPVTAPDNYSVDQGATLRVPRPGVLGNDGAPGAPALTAITHKLPERSAAFALNLDGSFSYRSERFFFGPDSFTYRASDGFQQSAPQRASVTVLPMFSDVPASHLFSDDIRWIGGQGITRGCNPPFNHLYCPDDTVSRGQMAALISRALGLPDTPKDFFDDDDGSVFEDDINRLARAGIVRGCNPPDNTQFCPNRRINRGEMATILVGAFGFAAGAGSDLFVDDDDSVHEQNIDRLGTAGVTRGCNPPTGDRYCPTDPVTRAQMAAFVRRAVVASGMVVGNPGLSVVERDDIRRRLELARP